MYLTCTTEELTRRYASGKAALQQLRKGVSPSWRHGCTWVSVRGRGRAKRAKNVSSPAVLRVKPFVLLLLFSDSHPRRLDCAWTLFRRCPEEPCGEETRFYSAAAGQKTNFRVLLRYVCRSPVSRSAAFGYGSIPGIKITFIDSLVDRIR